MKLIRMISCVIVLCSVALMDGCQKDNIDETGQSTSPNVSLRGGLAFKVRDRNGAPLQGVTISIAFTQYDLDHHKYLETHITNDNGFADFGMLNAGNYYYGADITIGDVAFHGEGVVQVQQGVNLVQELTLQ